MSDREERLDSWTLGHERKKPSGGTTVKMAQVLRTTLAVTTALLMSSVAMAQDWQPVTGDDLVQFISGQTLQWEEGGGGAWGEYRADGTGTLHAWGAKFDRAWEIKGDDQLCFLGEPYSQCWTLEKNTTDPLLFRATNAETGEVTEIRKTGADAESALAAARSEATSIEGGPAAPSAAEMANQLSNPANPIMIVFNNFDYVTFDGDLPGASDKTMTQYFFQTIIPWALDDGSSILFRPGIPVVFNQDVPNGEGGYDNVGTDLGDLGFDLVRTGTTEKGTIWGYGVIGTIPTATSDYLGGDKWALGLDAVLGKTGKWGSAGFVLGHQWDIFGSGDRDINLTTMNYFVTLTIKNGWAFSTAPTIVYNHEAPSGEELTLPLGVGIAKTVSLGGRPWQFAVHYWNNVIRPDSYAPQHTLRIAISPVFDTPWNK